jgi:hypothetical protein
MNYYSYSTKTFSSYTWKSTSTLYFSTKQGFTYVSDIETVTIYTYYSHYIETYSYVDLVTFTETDILVSFSTYIQYSTITRIVAPSPSILPKNKCTCIIPLCNRLDLVLLTINNIV